MFTFRVEDDSNAEEEEDQGDEDHDEEERQPAVEAALAPTRLVSNDLDTRRFPGKQFLN